MRDFYENIVLTFALVGAIIAPNKIWWENNAMFNTESIILLIISLLANTGLAIENNQFAKKISKTGSDLYFFMLVYSLVCVAVLFLSGAI